ncbi:RNA-binding protein NOB1 [Intoshia linei]|uniref:RNA-binding protein NOB1 n=1 Tax=Intoshia linei TaxID=1819745 RepID=A0A177B8E6_9BILA|nr:RNA-binding protein NOB1 [Intoshia linei]
MNKTVIVDANAFIHRVDLNIYNEIYVTPSVLEEVKSLELIEKYSILIAKCHVQSPEAGFVEKVRNVAIESGEIASLSNQDIDTISLILQIFKEKCGTSDINELTKENDTEQKNEVKIKKKNKSKLSNGDEHIEGFYSEYIKKKGKNSIGDKDTMDGWITPKNYKSLDAGTGKFFQSSTFLTSNYSVGCITGDFSMQNILLKLKLPIISPNGKLIKSIRNYANRCHICGFIDSNKKKKFCLHCGYDSLKKIVYTMDKSGKTKLHFSKKYKIHTKNTKYSIITPQSGKHPRQQITCADHVRPQEKSKKNKLLKRYDPLCKDYIGLESPFAPTNINCRSAMLGIYKNSKK